MTSRIVTLEFIQFWCFCTLLLYLETDSKDIFGFCNGNVYKALFFFNKLLCFFFLNKNIAPWLVFLIIILRLPCLEKRCLGIGSDSLCVLGKELWYLWAIYPICEWLHPLECPVSLKLRFFIFKAGDRK